MPFDPRIAEYESLRQEIAQNKKYIFERPLAVIGATALAMPQLSSDPAPAMLPVLFVVLLLLNLRLTVNRLRSNARIVAYIELVLEQQRTKWIGWESALREYRTAAKKGPKLKKGDSETHRFYQVLMWLHAVPVGFILLASVMYAVNNPGIWTIVGAGLAGCASFLFGLDVLTRLSPRRLRSAIDQEHVAWKKCFGLK